MQSIKNEYNKILEAQAKAFKWFESKDFEDRFKKEGEAFFNRALAKYNKYEKRRLQLLDELELKSVHVTREEIILGFKF